MNTEEIEHIKQKKNSKKSRFYTAKKCRVLKYFSEQYFWQQRVQTLWNCSDFKNKITKRLYFIIGCFLNACLTNKIKNQKSELY